MLQKSLSGITKLSENVSVFPQVMRVDMVDYFLPLQNSRLSCRRLQMKNFPHGARTEEKEKKSESGGYNDSVLICLRKSGFAPQSIGRMNPDRVGTHQRQAAREEGGIITLLIIR